MLTLHITFIFISLLSFIVRVALATMQSTLLTTKFFKISPHIIDTILLLTGISLVIQGSWLGGEYSWIIAKIMLLLVYIGLGVMVMRSTGIQRWLAFVAALSCYGYIIAIAVSKQSFLGLL